MPHAAFGRVWTLHGAQTAFARHIHRGEMRFPLRSSDGGAVSLPGNKKHHLRGHRGDDDPSVRASSWRSNARRPLPTCSAAPWHQCRTSLSRPFTSMPDVKRSTPWAAQETFHWEHAWPVENMLGLGGVQETIHWGAVAARSEDVQGLEPAIQPVRDVTGPPAVRQYTISLDHQIWQAARPSRRQPGPCRRPTTLRNVWNKAAKFPPLSRACSPWMSMPSRSP